MRILDYDTFKSDMQSILRRGALYVGRHKVSFWVAIFIGVLAVLPQLLFIIELGEEYRGIHFFQTPNEDAYLAIMQEIRDGHPLVASMPFYEYKNALPLLPPTIAIIYVVLSKLLGITLVTVLIASKFILPALLFFLVYLLIYKLGGEQEGWPCKWNAITGGLFVVLGFDLVGYRTIWNFFANNGSLGNALIWTRPVNPISGAILLFIFLLCLWGLIRNKSRYLIIPAAASIALMMASYVFSWTLALAVLGFVGLFALMRRRFKVVLSLAWIFGLGLVLSSPYWFMVWRASQMEWYAEAASRIGLLYTHMPHFNKFLFFILILFSIASFFLLYKKNKDEKIPEWWWFSLALLGAGFLVYNQQVITGREIWYYHYVFYTIPFGYVIFMTLIWHVLRPKFPKIWGGVIGMVMISSLFLGGYTLASYKKDSPRYKDWQKYADVADFFNTNAERDCVVLTNNYEGLWQNFILAFTHCNMYVSGERFVIAPPDRFYHNYLTLLRIKGVSSEDIDSYLEQNKEEAAGFLQYQLQRTLGFSDPRFETEFKRLPQDYKEFVKRNFTNELKKYRIDYILSVGPLDQKAAEFLPNITKVFEKADVSIYSF